MAKRPDEIHALLGKGTEFQGQLKFEGTVRIDGTFKGEIHAEGTLIVGDGARVEAQIRCGTLIVSGEVRGDIQATQRVEALSPARIVGNLQTPVLVINEGVLFDGQAKMEGTAEPGRDREKRIPFLSKSQRREEPESSPQSEGS